MANYNVKSIKYSRGHDADCMQCDLYNGKKKIAQVWDDSWGGDFQYTWLDKNEEQMFYDFISTLGKIKDTGFKDIELDYSADLYVNELVVKVTKEKEEKQRKNKYKNSIVVMKKGSLNYSFYKLPKAIADYPSGTLKAIVMEISLKLKADEYIVNDNLPA
jgi:hypothetical protein